MQVASVMRSVEGEIAEVDDDVRGVRADVAEHGIPVGFCLRPGAASTAGICWHESQAQTAGAIVSDAGRATERRRS